MKDNKKETIKTRLEVFGEIKRMVMHYIMWFILNYYEEAMMYM